MIEFEDVRIAYKDKPVLDGVSLTIHDREFFVLIGSSGCGKTTLLKTLNKLNPIDKGEILINGTPINRIKVTQLPRLMGYVVQEGGLFPHMTVEDNIALAMRVAGYPKEKIYDRITELLELVNLEPDQYRSQYPSQLSGGQRQRIGVARAFAADPEIILMDEPFAGNGKPSKKSGLFCYRPRFPHFSLIFLFDFISRICCRLLHIGNLFQLCLLDTQIIVLDCNFTLCRNSGIVCLTIGFRLCDCGFLLDL